MRASGWAERVSRRFRARCIEHADNSFADAHPRRITSDLSPLVGLRAERMCINDRTGFKILSETKRPDVCAASRHVFPSSDVSRPMPMDPYKNEAAVPVSRERTLRQAKVITAVSREETKYSQLRARYPSNVISFLYPEING